MIFSTRPYGSFWQKAFLGLFRLILSDFVLANPGRGLGSALLVGEMSRPKIRPFEGMMLVIFSVGCGSKQASDFRYLFWDDYQADQAKVVF